MPSINFTLNGERRDVEIDDPRVTLLDLLRERLHLTGTKKGCDRGQCGACTVLVDGWRINSCLTLAMSCDGADVLTIEGVARGDVLDPVQAAFVAHDALQCGFCTPGLLVAAKALLDANPDPTESEARYWLAGNLCRCTGYDKVIRAVMDAAAELRQVRV